MINKRNEVEEKLKDIIYDVISEYITCNNNIVEPTVDEIIRRIKFNKKQ